MESIIKLNNVTFSAQDKKIIQEISVEFKTGIATAIVGPSGGGKSTMLKVSAGLLLPSYGEVLYKGKNVALMSRAENLDFRRESAFVFQDSALWANQDLNQILELPLKIHFPKMTETERIKRIKEVTDEVGYRKELDIRPSRLSMGEQKLIGFARSLLCDPLLLYLDEWTESLDETQANRLIKIVHNKVKNGATVIFICHDMRIMSELADHVVIISNGNIVMNAAKEQIANDTELSNYLRMGMAL
ncbi:MAG: ATP-binding cassette domain-containing protein [Treponema sp.]|nr:ATP-binding cassette domain-containing protein [Treponema sp.]